MTIDDAQALGRAARAGVPRKDLRAVMVAPDRDPVGMLVADEADRIPDLVPLRRERMLASPFAFYRGSAGLMAADLAAGPSTGLAVQSCGDAHLANFGVFASPERALVFDVNDFDETHPAPFEWDLKRMLTSAVLAARDLGLGRGAQARVTAAGAAAYREVMAKLAELGELDVWYQQIPASRVAELTGSRRRRKQATKVLSTAMGRTSRQIAAKLTTVVDGQRRFVDDPPVMEHVGAEAHGTATTVLEQYVATLAPELQVLLGRYDVLDVARKAVGVGSLGTRCFVVLLQGRDVDDVLILQLKEAGASVLEPHTEPSRFAHHGERVVVGQRTMQAASDIFLGWVTGTDDRQYYWRQLRDMKYSVDLSRLTSETLEITAGVSGWALARAHAKGGNRLAVSAYLGRSSRADAALCEFAFGYAEQVERDYRQVTEALGVGTG